MNSTNGFEFLDVNECERYLEVPQNETETYFNFNEMLSVGTIVPSSTSEHPILERYPGPYNFEVKIDTKMAGPDCQLSSRNEMDKLFVRMDKKIPVQIRLNNYAEDLLVRGLLVYYRTENRQTVVTRCTNHIVSDTKERKDVDIVHHVLRCNSPGSQYHKNEATGRYSVTSFMEAPQPGSDCVTKLFEVKCLNSCIERKNTAIIFTLEDMRGNVLGRHSMEIRICSCPKRDKQKEESFIALEENLQKIKQKRSRNNVLVDEQPAKISKKESVKFEIENVIILRSYAKELAKFAVGLIYRDIGMEQRNITEQEASLISFHEKTIEEGADHLN